VKLPLAIAAVATVASLSPVIASAPDRPHDARAVIERMLADNPRLVTYRARVHVSIRMLNFPYLSPSLDGTSYYQRPSAYAVVFDRVPFYMHGFSKLFDNMGDPGAWEQDQNAVLVGTTVEAGRRLYLLRLTKKIYSDILDHTDAYVDAANFQLVRMEWHYRSGGSIVMTQSYRVENGFALPSGVHAAVDIPHVRAVGDAIYDRYQVNVPISSTVFQNS
jgi:hypothetical protein